MAQTIENQKERISRMEEAMKYLGLNRLALSHKIGEDPTKVTRVLNMNWKNFPEDFFDKFLEMFPTINPDYLNLKSSQMIVDPITYYKNKGSKVPYYDVEASLGDVNYIPTQDQIKGYIDMPETEDCDFIISVRGDSMYPTLTNGDKIACKWIFDTEIIQWGNIYLVITHDNQRMVKILRKSSQKDDSKLELHSKNATNFEPIVISKDKVLRLALVKAKLSSISI